MPAHLRPLPRCNWFGCDRPATEELYNAAHAPSGRYCTRHAQQALVKFQREVEQRSWSQ